VGYVQESCGVAILAFAYLSNVVLQQKNHDEWSSLSPLARGLLARKMIPVYESTPRFPPDYEKLNPPLNQSRENAKNTPQEPDLSTYTRPQLDDLLKSDVHKLVDWRENWSWEQFQVARLRGDAHLDHTPPNVRDSMLKHADDLERDPWDAAMEPSDVKSLVSTSYSLQSEVVKHWLSVIDKRGLPQPDAVEGMFKRMRYHGYAVTDISSLIGYMQLISRKFEATQGTN
jgi:hypothetical protein